MGGCLAGPSVVVRRVRGWEGAEFEFGRDSLRAPGCVTAFRYVLWCRLPHKGDNHSLPFPPRFCTVASPKASARVTASKGRGTQCVSPEAAGLAPSGETARCPANAPTDTGDAQPRALHLSQRAVPLACLSWPICVSRSQA